MKLGIIIGDVRTSVPPAEHLDQLLRQVEAAQRNGFTHITIGQHFMYGDLRWLQPVPVLARLAAEVDPHITLATNIVVVPLYHPVLLAEELATLDIITAGRLVVGAGIGYRTQEFDYLGVPYGERISRFEESLELIRRLWNERKVDHHGRHWRFEGAEPHLRPVQQPHPQIWIGAQSAPGVRRAARLGDRWTISPREPLPALSRLWETYRRERETLGLPVRPPIMRRDLILGRDRTDALERFGAMAQGRYLAYANRELAALDADTVASNFSEAVKDTVLAGSPDQVIDQLRAIHDAVPLDAILVRPQWPDMSAADVVNYLDDLGRDIAPRLTEFAAAPL
ncbi:LLM class flavin-dependent oxidoreductase [Polymorphospora lycopeni]|uniref:LLM class flavin-dependent oxidoreductase n=1 Tax=Polymorphospora lycopeni TaxID=3140240 RepID=A0ABV5CR22_9ACTN